MKDEFKWINYKNKHWEESALYYNGTKIVTLLKFYSDNILRAMSDLHFTHTFESGTSLDSAKAHIEVLLLDFSRKLTDWILFVDKDERYHTDWLGEL